MQTVSLAVVAALTDEIKIIRSRMKIDVQTHVRPALFMRGTYLQQSILLVRSGIGISAMDGAIKHCLDYYLPDFCLHVGYCGGADPHYKVGDLLIADCVVDGKSGERYKSDPKNIERAVDVCAKKGFEFKVGNLVTVEDVVRSPDEKAFVGTRHEAQAMDMESSVFVSACKSKNLPYLVVRAILDPLDEALPDISSAIAEDGSVSGLAIAGHIIKKPKDLFTLPRLEYFATQARNVITAFVDAWIENANL